jgi:prephenate dehydrogenase
MSGRVRTLGVVGLGLLGGSVARAARERGLTDRVVATGRRTRVLEDALAGGIVDAVVSVEEVGQGADLLVLATPVGSMHDLLRRAAPLLTDGALVTDVGSVKAVLADTLPGLLPPGVEYVGAHPMAGSHERGVEHARADLFEGAPCIVTPSPDASPAAVERIEAFWRGLGARVVRRTPADHDAEVAWTSHLPHVLAFAFSRALADAPADAREVLGSGFRDFTRIARSDPGLWTDILSANRKALAGPLQRAAERLAELAQRIEAGDGDAVERLLGEAREALAALAPNREIPTPDPGAQTRKSSISKGAAPDGADKIKPT